MFITYILVAKLHEFIANALPKLPMKINLFHALNCQSYKVLGLLRVFQPEND